MPRRALLLTLTLSALLATTPAALAGTRITGSLEFDPQDNRAGAALPVRDSWVLVDWCQPIVFACDIHGHRRVKTDANGQFSLTRPYVKGTTYRVAALAENDAASVLEEKVVTAGPFMAPIGGPQAATADGQTLDFSRYITGTEAKYFDIAEVLRVAHAWVLDHQEPGAWKVPQVDVITQRFVGTTVSFYDAPIDAIQLHPSDHASVRTMLHEYGHYVNDMIGNLHAWPAYHGDCKGYDVLTRQDIRDPKFAFAEAFGSAFADAILMETGVHGVAPATGDAPVACAGPLPPESHEGTVQAALIDLYDRRSDRSPAGEDAGDLLSRDSTFGGKTLDRLILEVLDEELAFPATQVNPDIRSLVAALKARGVDAEALDCIMIINGLDPGTCRAIGLRSIPPRPPIVRLPLR